MYFRLRSYILGNILLYQILLYEFRTNPTQISFPKKNLLFTHKQIYLLNSHEFLETAECVESGSTAVSQPIPHYFYILSVWL